VSSGDISIFTISPFAIPCSLSVSTIAILLLVERILIPELKLLILTILDPIVSSKLLLFKKY
jgi:hypothetical protein